jgi:phospholipase/carboxylesterase
MYEDGRLASRPAKPTHYVAPGVHRLALASGGLGYMLVPAAEEHERPRPFLLMLHGAGGFADRALDLVRPAAESAGIVVLAPQSLASTWDAIRAGYGPDVEQLDDLLAVAFARFQVDPARLAIGGFSDGASYALALAMANGELFTHVLAFSPNHAAPAAQPESPRIFISHGTDDEVLPIDRCSRRLVALLRKAGYDTVYREFDGGHLVPESIQEEAVQWLAQSPAASSRGGGGRARHAV